MITTITLNPAIDRTITVDECILGQVHRIKSCREDIGGKGINVAKVINRLNGQIMAIGYLGNENKKIVDDFFLNENMKVDFVAIDDHTRINTKVVDIKNSSTTEFNEMGFTLNENHLVELKSKVKEYAAKSDYMVFSGSIPRGCPKDIYKDLIETVRDETKVVLDADGELLKEGVQASPFLIKPNIHELKNTFNIKIETIDDVIVAALDLINKYHIQWILISMGKDGSVLVSNKQIFVAETLKVDAKSSVGAGDSMLGGFVYSYSVHKDPKVALAYGTVCGALAVTTEGTQVLFTKEQVEDMHNKIVISDVSDKYLHH